MYLAFAPYGESLVVTGVRADGNVKRHLESLGIMPGCVMTSLYDNGGDVIVKIGDGKLALGKSVALKVEVEPQGGK